MEINTNKGKVKILVQIFFPEKPECSRVLENYNYPEPLPPLPPITPEQIEHQIRRLSPYKASGPDEIPNVVLHSEVPRAPFRVLATSVQRCLHPKDLLHRVAGVHNSGVEKTR